MVKSDTSVAVVTLMIIGAYLSALALHIYGCWIIGGAVGIAIFFFPPIPVIVAVAHTLGLI